MAERCRRLEAFNRFLHNRREDQRTKRELGITRASVIQDAQNNSKDENATQQDFQERKIFQIRRFLELESFGKMTRQWQDFGKKHAEEITYFRKQKPL